MSVTYQLITHALRHICRHTGPDIDWKKKSDLPCTIFPEWWCPSVHGSRGSSSSSTTGPTAKSLCLYECGVQAISWMLPKNEKYSRRLCPEERKKKQNTNNTEVVCVPSVSSATSSGTSETMFALFPLVGPLTTQRDVNLVHPGVTWPGQDFDQDPRGGGRMEGWMDGLVDLGVEGWRRNAS